MIFLKTNHTDPVSVFIYYIFLTPIYANIAFFLYYSSAAAFLGSLGLAGAGGFPPLALAS